MAAARGLMQVQRRRGAGASAALLAAALLAAALLAACASAPDEGSGSGLSAGNMSAGSTGGDESGGDPSSGGPTGPTGPVSASDGSGSGGASATGSGGDETTTTGDPTSDGSTTALDCASGLSNLCGNPYDLGSVNVGGVATGPQLTLLTPGAADWYKVSFPAVNRPGGGVPTLEFAVNDDDAFRFDLTTGTPCMGQVMSCGQGGEAGKATALKEWSFADDLAECCQDPAESLVPWPGTVYVRVYRPAGGESCAAYQLAVSR